MLEKIQKGQIILIVVMIMVIGLTIGLSVVARTIVSLRTTTDAENSQRAFSAAEAGIERALQTGKEFNDDKNLGNDSVIKNVEINELDGDEILLNGGNLVPKDDGVDIWLTVHRDDGELNFNQTWTGDLNINWGSRKDDCKRDEDNNTQAAIEVIVISGKTERELVLERHVFDPCGDRRQENKFNNANNGRKVQGVEFAHSKNINIKNGIVARAIPLYAGTSFGVIGKRQSGSNEKALPSQGNLIESVGASGNTERKISYYEGYPKLPSEFFTYVIFSPK